MELIPVHKGAKTHSTQKKVPGNKGLHNLPFTPGIKLSNETLSNTVKYKHKPFIEANTKEIDYSTLKNDCIIPVFAKDNERTISHQEFIEVTQECVNTAFRNHQIKQPEIRVSHQIKGRIPEAINKPVKELLDFEKTQYFERMAFVITISSIVPGTINNNELSLMVGGVRAYNQENLYSKKTAEKFKVFIGFKNMVCCNLCVSTDGYQDDIKVRNILELKEIIINLIQRYSIEKDLEKMNVLSKHSLSEQQFAQLIGKTKLYQYLPKREKTTIPAFLMNDSQISTIAKDYYQDEDFCRNSEGNINLWDVYNLFTSANKSSYIDSFLSRNVNAFEFANGLAKTLNGDSKYHWFLS